MQERDRMNETGDMPDKLWEPRDIALAIGLLTRLPLQIDSDHMTRRSAAAVWAFPIAGVCVALLAALIGWLALWSGLPHGFAMGLVLAVQIVMTGAMHEDGLADSADGLWGGWDRMRRLEIMKDSAIGTYGVLALILSLGLRWMALSALDDGFLAPLIIAAMFSRTGIVWTMAALPPARSGGLSKSVGRPQMQAFGLAAAVSLLCGLLLLGTGVIGAALATLGATLICAGIARAKIGGQTGDILGATQQISEIAVLGALVSLAG